LPAWQSVSQPESTKDPRHFDEVRSSKGNGRDPPSAGGAMRCRIFCVLDHFSARNGPRSCRISFARRSSSARAVFKSADMLLTRIERCFIHTRPSNCHFSTCCLKSAFSARSSSEQEQSIKIPDTRNVSRGVRYFQRSNKWRTDPHFQTRVPKSPTSLLQEQDTVN
jgi:hypothetical protein